MRQTTFKILNQDSVATYPDEMCFAFNPNFIEIESAWPSGVFTVTVEKISGIESVAAQSIKVSFYKGKCKIYLSRLFELMFDDPRNTRCIEVSVKVNIGTMQMFQFTTLVSQSAKGSAISACIVTRITAMPLSATSFGSESSRFRYPCSDTTGKLSFSGGQIITGTEITPSIRMQRCASLRRLKS